GAAPAGGAPHGGTPDGGTPHDETAGGGSSEAGRTAGAGSTSAAGIDPIRGGEGSPAPAFDFLPDGVLVVDGDRTIVAVNRALIGFSGYQAEDLIGRPCHDLLEWHDANGDRADGSNWPAPARLRGSRTIVPQPATLARPGGGRLPVTLTGTYLRDHQGALSGAVLTLRPPARGHNRQPSGMEIVSTVSHELRSPLTSVKGYTSLMLNRWERLVDDQKKMMLEQVNHDADRVTRLITELLDISRLETGRLILRRQMVDLPRLAASVVEKVSMEYPQLEATTDFPGSFPKVYADPDKIEQVLTNLVENACKYASPQGLRIDGTVGPDSVSVGVHDRGEGIPKADLPKVFTKFFRRSVGRPTGSGLGLWISRGLVESHGGELRAESKEGQGSTFRFTLPLIDLDELQSS
ncbi:MAG TPA: ATP-binding protein, partial [Acidimicrobiales bacterium]|nr:ATP-binding protein [Acidimicrobiales bacterium]